LKDPVDRFSAHTVCQGTCWTVTWDMLWLPPSQPSSTHS